MPSGRIGGVHERLWSVRRAASSADAILEDFGVNGVEIRIIATDRPARVDRFTTRELALKHAADQLERLRSEGWQ